MHSDNEIRRVRKEMSERAGHDIRALIASINRQWPDEATCILPTVKFATIRPFAGGVMTTARRELVDGSVTR